MVKSVNMVIIIGNLGNIPDIKEGKHGKIAKFSVATSEEWMNKESNKKFSRTDWHKITVFNPKLVDVCEKYLQKGTAIYIRGRLRNSSWVEQDGSNRTSTEIEMVEMKILSSKNDGARSDYNNDMPNSSHDSNEHSPESNEESMEIPF